MQKLENLPKALRGVEIWKEENRICVVFQFCPERLVKPFFESYPYRECVRTPFPGLYPYCTGYVEVLKENHGKSYKEFQDQISAEELTFSGNLYLFDKEIWFLGFDSNHAWDTEETRTPEAVKERTKKLALEMIRKKI